MHEMDVTEDDDEDIEHHEESIIDKATDDENVDDADDDYTFNDNRCHLCRKQLSNKDELWDHVECTHGGDGHGGNDWKNVLINLDRRNHELSCLIGPLLAGLAEL